jgi:major membrane immunogen (membrane-anchored lipoprotein)
MYKRIYIILLALSILLAACGGTSDKKANNGTSAAGPKNVDLNLDAPQLYKEIPVEYKNGIYDFAINDNDDLFITDKGSIYVYFRNYTRFF